MGTLSDDPSLGEAVIDAFWPDWPMDCFMMVMVNKLLNLNTSSLDIRLGPIIVLVNLALIIMIIV